MTVGYLVGAVIMIGLVIAVVAASVRGRRWYRYTPQTARSDVGWSPDTESTDDTGGMLSRPTVWIAAFFVVTTVSIAGIFFVATGSSIASMTTLMFGALAALLVVLAALSTGNGLLNVGIAALVSRVAGEDRQGMAFGVTQGAGSLGRTVGPPVMTGLYVFAVAAPFLLGAALTVGTVALLVGVARTT